MISANCFLDSNVILYLFDEEGRKREKAESLVSSVPYINSQVLVEVGNICKRKFGYSKSDITNIWSDLLMDCICVDIGDATMKYAIELIKRYDFQLFDSIIVASALEMKCVTLFSEDMQDGMVIDEVLTIVNPFI
ncbi:PIN domain-containing protein [Dyadobacter sp. CY312]|uniref:PIN domain-containing protein n=1 Tax=Dyadobacter sp. CY312 TaxID=2907303 RepID=UPI001F436BC3|nr:PIN domain-containing protein [Dyadobacter sp. CY312]MCE7041103.1 PIN domain-containing protein [Dyadobacter sp. CY312]